MSAKKHINGTANKGFALVIALSLMAFVVLLLLSLTTLSTVSTRSAGMALEQELARSNARLALMIALGDLQKSAGPDQRVTATADIAAGAEGSRIVDGTAPENNTSLDGSEKGLSEVLPGTRYWTAVFQNQDAPEDIYQKTPSARLQQWLVSGGNDSAIPPTPGDFDYRVGADGKVADGSKAILLVGPNSAGKDPSDVERYVAAPRVVVPGASSGNSGAFAYWVGDEGVKARINLARTENNSDAASLVAQRRAWETVAGFVDYPIPGEDGRLPEVFSLPNLESLVSTIGKDDLQTVFHSASPFSRGLLVNTLEGGMRVDLTTLLSGSLPTNAPVNAYANYPVTQGPVIEASEFPELQHLTWDHIQDFYQTEAGSIQVQAGTDRTNTFAPTLADLRLLFGVRLSDAQLLDPQVPAGGGVPAQEFEASVHLVVKIALTLSNPYTVPLEWNAPLELEMKGNTRDDYSTLTVYSYHHERSQASGKRQIAAFEPLHVHYLAPTNRNTGERNPTDRAAVLNRAIFRIPAGRLEPGQAVAYSHVGNELRDNSTPVQEKIVELEPIQTATLGDFNNSLEMSLGKKYIFPRAGLQIRASGTSRAILELRDSASGSILRRITNLELNNPYRRDTVSEQFNASKVFDASGAQKFTGSTPLLLYRFELSHPGEQYDGYSSFQMGLLGSTLRTYADFNIRATDFHNTIASYNPPPYFMEIIDNKSDLDWYNDVGGYTGDAFTQDYEYFEPSQYWGYKQTEGTQEVGLYSFPRQFVALAQLQHADLTQDATTRSVAHQPGNAFGNSYASPFVERGLSRQQRQDFELELRVKQAIPLDRWYYDISYLLNTAIWDRYFFSDGSPSLGTLGNPSLIQLPGASASSLQDPTLAATELWVDGAFNVNSTEKVAWKAFLGASKYFQHPADAAGSDDAAFARSLQQSNTFADPPTGQKADSYAGYRRLIDDQLDALAEAMVRQVRLRGPFVSRAHFINRALVEMPTQTELSYSGALQSALDSPIASTAINMNLAGDLNAFSELKTSEDRVRLQGGPDIPQIGNADPYPPDVLELSVGSILADSEMLDGNGHAAEQGYRSTGIPGWLTQADVLQVIGPAISARSDTFRIRTAGQNIGLSGEIVATAYLEAVVQRMPEFVDSADVAHAQGTLTATNQSYGRKFEIIAVRWLSPDEI